jgi:hypothetical protein
MIYTLQIMCKGKLGKVNLINGDGIEKLVIAASTVVFTSLKVMMS